MLLAALSPIDYGASLLYLAAVVAVGFYFARRQTGVTEYLLSNRMLGALPLGLSLTATLAGAAIVSLPGIAYEQGLKCWLIPLSFWLVAPIVVFLVIPIYRGLGLVSICEYLEYRFDSRLRRLGSLLIMAWRLMWLGILMSEVSRMIILATGWLVPAWTIIVLLGIVATLVACLGGMRAIVWSAAAHVGVMFAGVAVVVIGIWLDLKGGPMRVMEVAKAVGRLSAADAAFPWDDAWTIWAALPYWFLFVLSLLVSDQIQAQRLLCAKDVNSSRTSYLVCCLTLTFLLAGLIYIGLGLLAFFHDHPEHLRAEWVVNLDGRTHEPIRGDDGLPLLDFRKPSQQLTRETIDQLVAEGRVLQPNDKLPFTSSDDLLDPASGRVMVERLAMRRPRDGANVGELVLCLGSSEQLLPQFVARRLSWGAAGTVLAALIAAALSALTSGVHALGTLIVCDWQRDATHDVPRVRRLIALFSLAVTALAIVATALEDVTNLLTATSAALAAPLLALFLLGMLTRRTTASAALAATALGVLATFGLAVLGPRLGVSSVWTFVFGFAATFVFGYLLSCGIGNRPNRLALRGLVFRCGTLGLRASDEEIPIITTASEQ
jgi:Na+/proline symporter